MQRNQSSSDMLVERRSEGMFMICELEAYVIETFKALVACLPEAAKEIWLTRLEYDCAEADAIFSPPFDLERRYQFVVKIDSYFGGQDTLNDIVGVRAGEFRDIRDAFFYLRWALLREYWRALGRPSYEFQTFTPFARALWFGLFPERSPISILTAPRIARRL